MATRAFADGDGPAFPTQEGNAGMSLREYFAIHAPEPSQEVISFIETADRLVNPHNDPYKPKRRSKLEIICDLRFAYADEMLLARRRQGKT